MKIAISATGQNLEATIDERFGRCQYFIILETDDMSYEVIENNNADLPASAGIQSASLVASKGVKAVITGNCGPKAMQVFATATINVIIGQHGTIKDAVEQFKIGALTPSARENVPEKFGVAPIPSGGGFQQPGMSGGGRGMGGGGGRGMGGGGGRGMGGGGGRGMGGQCRRPYDLGAPGVKKTAQNLSKEQERAQLQQQADELKSQMDAIQAKINSLT